MTSKEKLTFANYKAVKRPEIFSKKIDWKGGETEANFRRTGAFNSIKFAAAEIRRMNRV